jgi:hypothetical protein
LTLQFYSHAVSQDRMAAAGEMLIAILSHAADQSGLGADWERTEERMIGGKPLIIMRLQSRFLDVFSNAD